MSCKVSIVMPYYNRINQLYLTLRTLEHWCKNLDVEVVIVDDASDQVCSPAPIIGKFDLNINLIEIKKEDKKWINPCHCFNIGFKEAKGEIIIIQSPETFHLGQVIGKAIATVTPDNYVLFPCKSIKSDWTERLWNFRDVPDCISKIEGVIKPILNAGGAWYHHPTRNPTCYHFLSAINRNTLLEVLGGFDERYAKGFAFDDNEFLERIKRSPLEIVQVSSNDTVGVHQWHPNVNQANCKDILWQNNWRLFIEHTKIETGWKANVKSSS